MGHTEIDGYRFSFQLFFDESTEAELLATIATLRSRGLVNANFIPDDYRPHVTLTAYRELDCAHAQHTADRLAASYSPIQVRFSYVGQFAGPIRALFLGPVHSPELRAIHDDLTASYRGRPEECWDLYSPERWIPHCAVLVDSASQPVQEGAAELLDRALPEGSLRYIGVTGFGPVRVLELGCTQHRR